MRYLAAFKMKPNSRDLKGDKLYQLVVTEPGEN